VDCSVSFHLSAGVDPVALLPELESHQRTANFFARMQDEMSELLPGLHTLVLVEIDLPLPWPAHGDDDTAMGVGTLLTIIPEDLLRVWSVSLMGAYYLCRQVLPLMIRAGTVSIINLGSIAGVMRMEDRFAYTVTKHAIVGMTRAMALDHGITGGRINAICPGRTLTPFVEARMWEYPEPEKFEKQLSASHALKRMAQPAEIASLALYLASDASSFVTGAAMMIDGGYSAGK
jgi:NAD(P)-dependent dehydrogenase (short-subunit alcohol dehydrogenase family)